MKESWISHNTDKLILAILLILSGIFIVHLVHHGGTDQNLLTFAEGSFSTILGALILILTGRGPRADGQTANGLPPTSTPSTPSNILTSPIQPSTDLSGKMKINV